MKRWKDRLATLFLVLALGLSLVPWVYEVQPVEANSQICYSFDWVEIDCEEPATNCACEIVITPQ